jgi:hypothetical protein
MCSCVWGRISNSRLLDYVDLASGRGRTLLSLLEIAQKALNFLMTARCGNVCELGTIDMLYISQLTNRLVDDTLRIVRGL